MRDHLIFDPTRRQHLRQLGVVLAGLGVGPAALALVGGEGPQDPDPQAPWAGVGSLDSGRSLFSATPIDRSHVITAGHVAAGADVQRVSFRLRIAGGFVSRASALYMHPAYRGMVGHKPQSDPTVHHDLAIVRLAQPLPESVPIPPIFAGDLAGRTLTLISHSGSTTLISIGENIADVIFSNDLGLPATYLFDFDGPDLASNRFGPPLRMHGTLGARREAALVGGDSGSAAFVFFDGRWWLAGVNSFRITFNVPPDSSGYGVAGGGVVLASHTDWMRSVIDSR